MPFELTTESHVELLHFGKRYGNIIYRSPDESGQNWQKVSPSSQRLLPDSWEGGAEHFVLPNEFWWGQDSLLRSLTCCYVDIDGTRDTSLALAALEQHQFPPPSLVVYSGNGLHFYWLTKRAPADAVPGWRRIQLRFHQVLANLLPPKIIDGKEIRIGADPTSKASTKNLRLVGSLTKSGGLVTGTLLDEKRFSLRELEKLLQIPRPKNQPDSSKLDRLIERMDAPLPIRDEIAPGKGYSPSNAFIGEKLPIALRRHWQNVVLDIERISAACGYVPFGHRNMVLFNYSAAQAWLLPPHELFGDAIYFIRMRMPEFEFELGKSLDTVIRKAYDSARGKKVLHEGREVDPRYHFSGARIRFDLLSLIQSHPQVEPHLRALASRETLDRREKERQLRENDKRKAIRARAGKRPAWLKKVNEQGDELYAQAASLRAQGLSLSEIGAKLGRNKSSISRVLRKRMPKAPV